MLLQPKPVLTRTYIVRQKKQKAENHVNHVMGLSVTTCRILLQTKRWTRSSPLFCLKPQISESYSMQWVWLERQTIWRKVVKKSQIVSRIVKIQIHCYVPYVQRETTRTVRDGGPGPPSGPSHSSWAVKSSSSMSLYVHIDRNFSSNSLTRKSNITVDNNTYCIF